MSINLRATPLVYNLKIRRVFTGITQFLQKEKKALWIASAVPIIYRRSAHIVNERSATDVCDKRSGGGSLFNLRYVPSRSWWLEGTTAVQKEMTKTTGTSNFCASRTGFDDVVIAGGYNIFPSESSQLGFYGLAGFPTRWAVTLQEAQAALVGSRFYSLGGGAEISQSFISHSNESLTGIAQVRVIHFFNRSWEPILPAGSKIQPGQTIDILLSLRYRHNLTLFEGGYNPTFFINQAVILPTETITSKSALRHGAYISITHLTQQKVFGKPLIVGTGAVFNRSERFDASSFSWWFSLTLII